MVTVVVGTEVLVGRARVRADAMVGAPGAGPRYPSTTHAAARHVNARIICDGKRWEVHTTTHSVSAHTSIMVYHTISTSRRGRVG